ncbi:MAG: N-acetylmuramoyl-L-alanine amidase [Ruminococcaceae bacterium]|nr:N-acetylmuramoyl-L-alanine amidase [Oscillospiraceae bacterium]
MKKTVLTYLLIILLSSILLTVSAIGFGAFEKKEVTSSAEIKFKYSTVIIDAGHGGEDGGTSSKSGLVEKDINLSLAFILKEKLEAQGVNVILTRDSDKLLYDRNTDFQGRKKKLDMAARLNIIQNTPGCIFISLHMNAFSDARYSGLQVWYSDNNPESQILANKIQKNIQERLQAENNRKTKSAGSSIYLLEQSYCPAVLVECGFLSNVAEAKLFESDEYKDTLCSHLCDSVIEFLKNS